MSKRARSETPTKRDHLIKNEVNGDVGKRMFLNEDFADFHFLFEEEGTRIPGHKAILAAGSDVFATMLNGSWAEENETKIDDVSGDAFKEFLQFFYKSEVKISTKNVFEVVYLADKYNVRTCIELLEPNIMQRTTTTNLCTFLDLALRFNLNILKSHCLTTICSNTTKLLKTKAFLNCSKDVLRTVLTVDRIDCSESDLFNACINWAKHKCEMNGKNPSHDTDIRDELGDCLYLIRFGAMEPLEISKCISRNKELFTGPELCDIWLSIGSNKSQVEMFKKYEPRCSFHKWDDSLSFHCDLSVGAGTKCEFYGFESTEFQISKSLLFCGITVNRIRDSLLFGDVKIDMWLFVFESSNNLHGQTKILERNICLGYGNESNARADKIKFDSVRLEANKSYEIRIVSKKSNSSFSSFYQGTSIGRFQRKQFGDGLTLHTQSSCSNLIRALHFNP